MENQNKPQGAGNKVAVIKAKVSTHVPTQPCSSWT